VTRCVQAGAAALLLAAALPGASRAADPAPTIDPSLASCADVLALAPAERTRVALWLDGLIKATRNEPHEVGDTAIGHPLDAVFDACKADPARRFSDVWIERYPGSQSATPPFKVTCAELAKRDPSVRAQVAAFLEGYAFEPAMLAGERPKLSLASGGPRLDAACKRTPNANAAEAFRKAP
jgi:hypothetical protein